MPLRMPCQWWVLLLRQMGTDAWEFGPNANGVQGRLASSLQLCQKARAVLGKSGTDITDSADGWAHLKQEYVTLESQVWEEGK